MKSFSKDLYWVALAYILAICLAAAVVIKVDELPPLLKAFYADVAATLVIFGFGTVFRNSSFYDPYWSLPLYTATTRDHTPTSELEARHSLKHVHIYLYTHSYILCVTCTRVS